MFWESLQAALGTKLGTKFASCFGNYVLDENLNW